MPDFDVLVAGDLYPDLIVTGDFSMKFGQSEEFAQAAGLDIGSPSLTFACGAARLELKAAVTGLCGDDFFGRFTLEQLQSRRVDVSAVKVIPGGNTGLRVFLTKGKDRTAILYPGLISPLDPAVLSDDVLRKARHLHVPNCFTGSELRPHLAELFTRAHALGLTTSLDTNLDPTEKWTGLPEVLKNTDVFFLNEKEAIAISSHKSPDEALSRLSGNCPLVVMKCGKDGGKMVAGRSFLAISPAPMQVVDTIGAGDSFDAGFICGYLNGLDGEKSLRLAVKCGALSTRASGGTAGQASLAEVTR